MNAVDEIYNFWSAAGYFVLPLLVMSFLSWLWLINMFLKLQKSSFRTSKYASEITQRLFNKESRTSIRQWLSTQEGIVPRIIEYIFRTPLITPQIAKSRYQEASEAEINSLQKEFGILSAIVKTAPLLGLLGTVAGMIETFAGLGSTGGSTDVMASGISKALLTTQLGLLIALPGIFGLEFLKRKFNMLLIELERLQFHVNALYEEKERLNETHI